MKDLPAWLSAGVASLAFLSTTTLAVGNRLRDRRNEKREAYAIALAVTPDLLKLRIEIGPIATSLDTYRDRIAGKEGILNNVLLHEVLKGVAIPMPYLLERHIDRLAKLGSVAGKACLETVSTLTHYQQMLARTNEALAAGKLLNPEQTLQHLGEMLRILANEAHEATTQITSRYKVL